MTAVLGALASIAVGYLCGSIPFGLLWVRVAAGRDVRAVGSGNIGATNALRAGGRAVGLATLLCDGLKGAVGFLLAEAAGRSLGLADSSLLAAASPVLGHCAPVWLGFSGGKGVATALGALAAADWRLALVAVAVFLVTLGGTRIVSLASLGATLACAAGALALPPPAGRGLLGWGVAAMALMIFVRHAANLRRLARGIEPRLGSSSGAERTGIDES